MKRTSVMTEAKHNGSSNIMEAYIMARKKAAKVMYKEEGDLHKLVSVLAPATCREEVGCK